MKPVEMKRQAPEKVKHKTKIVKDRVKITKDKRMILEALRKKKVMRKLGMGKIKLPPKAIIWPEEMTMDILRLTQMKQWKRVEIIIMLLENLKKKISLARTQEKAVIIEICLTRTTSLTSY